MKGGGRDPEVIGADQISLCGEMSIDSAMVKGNGLHPAQNGVGSNQPLPGDLGRCGSAACKFTRNGKRDKKFFGSMIGEEGVGSPRLATTGFPLGETTKLVSRISAMDHPGPCQTGPHSQPPTNRIPQLLIRPSENTPAVRRPWGVRLEIPHDEQLRKKTLPRASGRATSHKHPAQARWFLLPCTN